MAYLGGTMSIEYCLKHDRQYDTDFELECPECEMAEYWYKFTHEECPVCGRTNTDKERQYNTSKPKEWLKRHTWIQVYDYCNSL